MITATCTNDTCRWHNVERTMLGAPGRIVCGECENDCDLTDPRDDPLAPDEPA